MSAKILDWSLTILAVLLAFAVADAVMWLMDNARHRKAEARRIEDLERKRLRKWRKQRHEEE